MIIIAHRSNGYWLKNVFETFLHTYEKAIVCISTNFHHDNRKIGRKVLSWAKILKAIQ